MFDSYSAMEKERAQAGLPPLALTPQEVEEVCQGLESADKDAGRPAPRPAREPGAPGSRCRGQGQGRLARGRGQGGGQVARGRAAGRRAHPRHDARRLQRRAARRGALRRVDRRRGRRGAEEDRPRLRPIRDDRPEARGVEPPRQVRPRIVGGGGVVPVAAGLPRQARPQGLQGRRRDQHRRFLAGRRRADPPGHPPARQVDGPEALPGRQRPHEEGSATRATAWPSSATSSAPARAASRPATR